MNATPLSPMRMRTLIDDVARFGRQWGTGYVNQLVADGQISRHDADAVIRNVSNEWDYSDALQRATAMGEVAA